MSSLRRYNDETEGTVGLLEMCGHGISHDSRQAAMQELFILHTVCTDVLDNPETRKGLQAAKVKHVE